MGLAKYMEDNELRWSEHNNGYGKYSIYGFRKNYESDEHGSLYSQVKTTPISYAKPKSCSYSEPRR